MGIPHLFRHFARRCPHAVKVIGTSSCSSDDDPSQLRRPFAELHVDFNSVVHSCARDVTGTTNNTCEDVEAKVIEACMVHVAWLVGRFRPSDLVHVAVDGVPPRAKMSQQRSRRYLKHFFDREGEVEKDGSSWDSNMVTPGTPFMRRLDEALHASLEGRIREECANRGIPIPKAVLVSGSDEPGEGEQKIFLGLRNRREEPWRSQGWCCIYGLDADLLLMSMAHPLHHRLVIMREQDLRGPIQLVDVSALAKHASSEIAKLRWEKPRCEGDEGESADVAEYVALCALLGNDFVPALPGLSIRHGGVDAVLAAYGRAQGVGLGGMMAGASRDRMARGGPASLAGLDTSVLSAVLQELTENEGRALEDREMHHASTLEAALKKRNLTEEEDYPILPSAGPRVWVRPGVPGWRPRYYGRVFFCGPGASQSDIYDACIEYVMALAWSVAYLSRQECMSIGWHYRHPHAPTAMDVHKALCIPLAFVPSGSVDAAFRSADRAHRLGERAVGSREAWQHLHVLPPQTHSKLFHPASLEGQVASDPRLGCVHMFPTHFKLVTYLKDKFHECIPVLPEMDPSLLTKGALFASTRV